MKARNVRTYSPKPGDVSAKWHLIDADGVVLGRLASQIATLLRGKHKPTFAPNFDGGDYVVVINAEKVVLTGNKWDEKMAYHHSGFPGGLKATSYGKLREQQPEKVIERAVRGMMPHTTLGRNQLRKLKVYAGAEHPHAGQNPEVFELTQIAQ
ncbi:ribosomal protein L13 [Mobiluncus mulieris 28-1]|uniref:Large ribosomal subunit protein uL13 n=1 Tax=Mobiluncus mulieris TaxID=2052 RepID=A0A378PD15_9ACTO|nr:50S ribosomal protein L13 [Mobiluncus mulieris]EEZ91348.1 ribosomal protein L13 [Mobiluncus mulieris 28-1]STO15920.1 50S ribosomal protein L13 [Mobiluncus mulieris]STY84132.1 50S ribosomal protein L13 [Mobiluncus mulieris]